ncbi:hypothetical protein KC19_VG216500 [Ceratodon purpureus]|uniref:Uncharacterized protein n=1 Tax=Ceratodon purpureus TaxID=3225 RepID=A0A8T0HSQ3_CERPU|nr:hypothetical protein KC19_VG216500 [Ceratodon purpureus]
MSGLPAPDLPLRWVEERSPQLHSCRCFTKLLISFLWFWEGFGKTEILCRFYKLKFLMPSMLSTLCCWLMKSLHFSCRRIPSCHLEGIQGGRYPEIVDLIVEEVFNLVRTLVNAHIVVILQLSF